MPALRPPAARTRGTLSRLALPGTAACWQSSSAKGETAQVAKQHQSSRHDASSAAAASSCDSRSRSSRSGCIHLCACASQSGSSCAASPAPGPVPPEPDRCREQATAHRKTIHSPREFRSTTHSRKQSRLPQVRQSGERQAQAAADRTGVEWGAPARPGHSPAASQAASAPALAPAATPAPRRSRRSRSRRRAAAGASARTRRTAA